MTKGLARFLAVLTVLAAAPALAQTPEERAQLIAQLPSPDRVASAVPERADALETAVLRMGMLQEMRTLAQTLGAHPPPRELEAKINAYWQADQKMRADLARQLGPNPDQKIYQIGEKLFATAKQAYQFRRQVFANALDGDLRGYALEWHDRQPDVRQAMGTAPPPWLNELPPEVRAVLDPILAKPPVLWLSVALVWILLGIAFRTVPFHLLPDDVWTLQRGRGRRRMEHAVSLVTEVREAIEEVRDVRRPVDQHGNPTGPDQVSVRRYNHMKIFTRRGDQENVIQLTDQPFNARAGHRLLEVYDATSRKYVFLYNYDMDLYLPMNHLRKYVKMRPLILLPVWALSAYLTFKFAPLYALTALWATPLVYLVFMGIVNSRRRRKFMREMAPRMVEAARP